MKFAASARLSKNVEQAEPADPYIVKVLGLDTRSAAEAQLGTPEEEAQTRAMTARAAMRAADAAGSTGSAASTRVGATRREQFTSTIGIRG